MTDEIGELARRVAARVLAERGMVLPRPAPEAAGRGPELLTAAALASVPDGGRLGLPAGARATPLAQEEAHRRGITICVGSGAGRARLVALGCDHAGYALKCELLRRLGELGHRTLDLGARDASPCDYPDQAAAVARAVADGRAELGVCVDGSGVASAIAANKIRGVRAAACWDEVSARSAREHALANVLCLAARFLARDLAERILRAFLATDEGAGRHARRAAKISELERRAALPRAD